MAGLGDRASTPQVKKADAERILEELVVLARQQMRILSSPEELFGKEVLSLLAGLVHDIEGTAARLNANERTLALALTARSLSVVGSLKRYLGAEGESPERAKVIAELMRFSKYVSEFQRTITGGSPRSIEDLM